MLNHIVFIHLCDSGVFFFFNDTATTEIYTLSLHDALPIFRTGEVELLQVRGVLLPAGLVEDVEDGDLSHLSRGPAEEDRKSTRLNSSHANISYAVFCLKKKNTTMIHFYAYTIISLHYMSVT